VTTTPTTFRLLAAFIRDQAGGRVEAACRGDLPLDRILSFALGWWGLPWGIVMTAIQCGRNIAALFSQPDALRPSQRLQRIVRLGLAEEVLLVGPPNSPRVIGTPLSERSAVSSTGPCAAARPASRRPSSSTAAVPDLRHAGLQGLLRLQSDRRVLRRVGAGDGACRTAVRASGLTRRQAGPRPHRHTASPGLIQLHITGRRRAAARPARQAVPCVWRKR
jgi:hypothetical protein